MQNHPACKELGSELLVWHLHTEHVDSLLLTLDCEVPGVQSVRGEIQLMTLRQLASVAQLDACPTVNQEVVGSTLLSLLEECVRRHLAWKEAMEEKGLRANAGKTMIMIGSMGLDLLQSSGEFACAVCRTGVDSNSIFCNSCKYWVHKKCSGLKSLTKDLDFRCTQCQGTACLLDGRPQLGSPSWT